MTKTILLVGADGGLGSSLAARLIGAGYTVLGSVSGPGKVATVQASQPGLAEVFALDLADPEGLREKLQGRIEALDTPLSAVVVCAAVSPAIPGELTPIATMQRVLDINCVSNLAIYQATVASLRKTKGRVVFTSSLSGEVGLPLQGAYCTSKFALEGLADVLRLEAAEFGVDIVLLQPGGIVTTMVDKTTQYLNEGLASLSPTMRPYYEAIYRQFLLRIDESKKKSLATSPTVAAEAAFQALKAPRPLARYTIGQDAEQLLHLARTLSDAELDKALMNGLRAGDLG